MTREGEIKKAVDISEILQYPPSEHKWLYESKRHKKRAPQSFKYKQSVEEVAVRLSKHIVNLIHQFTEVKHIEIAGMIGDKPKQISWGGYGSYHEDYSKIGFRMENKDYKRFTEKSKVSSPHSDDYEEAVKHLAEIREFLNSLPKLEELEGFRGKG